MAEKWLPRIRARREREAGKMLRLEQLDLDGFSQFGSECKTCMYWWNENITAELPELE